MSETLYERLGGADAIQRIATDIVKRHKANPVIQKRFVDSNDEQLVQLVAQFFSMGSGGPSEYDGRSMPEAHRGMNITGTELVSTIDDVLDACRAEGVDEASCNEVLAILYSLKGDVLDQ